jgi:hypothetical protein
MKFFTCLIVCVLLGLNMNAQPVSDDDGPDVKRKVTLSSGIEGNIFQFAKVTAGAIGFKTIPRYTYFFNMGVDIDFHAHKNVLLFTGFQLKNIGIITALNDSLRYKERVYTFGAPLGVKLQTKNRKFMMKMGADIALALNYKRKHFLNNVKVTKFNEFFSDQANLMFASVFAGFTYSGLTLSGNYYLTNFYNPSTTTTVGRLVTISLGLHIDEHLITPSNKSKNNQSPW